MAESNLMQCTTPQQQRNFHGAALIGADGREVPITEEMVNQSLEALDATWRAVRGPDAQHHA